MQRNHPLIFVREPRPPAPRFGVSLRPHEMHWQTLASDGRILREAEQPIHNLVLNQAWDSLIAQHGFSNLNRYAVVGTGSTAPAANQTGLTAEAARTNTGVSGQPDTVTRVSNGVYEITRYREFSEAQVGGLNLTEWGWSPVAAAGNNLMSRELFRDGGGNPITLTLATDQKLRLIYKTRITLGPVSAAHAINIANLGNYTGTAKLFRYYQIGITTVDNMDLSLADAWAAGATLYVCVDSLANPNWGYNSNVANWANISLKAAAPQAYANDRKRVIPAVTFPSNEANQNITRIFIKTSNLPDDASSALQFWLDTPFTKDNLHKLIIGQWQLSWGP
jgi:hypothetical protein